MKILTIFSEPGQKPAGACQRVHSWSRRAHGLRNEPHELDKKKGDERQYHRVSQVR
jgi:hypothetical protein